MRRLPFRPPAAAKTPLLVLASFALALAIAEIGLRASAHLGVLPAGAESGAPEPDAERAGRPPETPEECRGAEPLPELETLDDLTRPDACGLFRGAVYRTNGAGFRGPDYTTWPRPGVFRIAVTGDSVTMGSGVAEEDAYPAQLERLLDRRSAETEYEVLNLGLAGVNLDVAVRRLKRLGFAYHPDLVVYGFTVNDIQGPHYVQTVTPGVRAALLARYERMRRSPFHLVRVAGPRLLTLWHVIAQRPGSFGYELRENYFDNEAAWRDFASGLDDLAALAERRRVCAHVLVHTQLVQLDALHPFRNVYEKVADAARARGLAVTETFEAYRGLDADRYRLSRFDPHPNRAGHALAARELLEGLQQLPDECWKPRIRPLLRRRR